MRSRWVKDVGDSSLLKAFEQLLCCSIFLLLFGEGQKSGIKYHRLQALEPLQACLFEEISSDRRSSRARRCSNNTACSGAVPIRGTAVEKRRGCKPTKNLQVSNALLKEGVYRVALSDVQLPAL